MVGVDDSVVRYIRNLHESFLMAKTRHRGKFDSENPNPYELSRGKIEDFISCKACFWLDRVSGVKKPEIPSFTINTTTDILLKRDADKVRGKETMPLLEANGLGHLIPFEHEDLEDWTDSMRFAQANHFNTLHEETHILFGGGLDDVYQNSHTGQIHIVDYKSTAQGTRSPDSYVKKPVSLDDPWKQSYKRQIDMYVWIARRMGFDVSNTGYFVYVDAQHKDLTGMLTDEDTSKAWMEFDVQLIAYESNTDWVEPTLLEIKDFLLNQKECPEHTPVDPNVPYSGCDVGRYLNGAMAALGR